MSAAADPLAVARQVADAVLYEGYILFPYRASALKNRYRWQWGVVIPRAQADIGGSEPCALHCEMLLRAAPGTVVDISARFLQLRLRQMVDAEQRPVDELEVDGQPMPTWEEGIEHEVTVAVTVGESRLWTRRFALDGGEQVERLGAAGTAVRTTQPVQGELRVDVTQVTVDVYKLSTSVHNETPWSVRRAPRDDVLRRSIVGVHVLAHAATGDFASAIDPPDWVPADVGALRNRGLHPVLVGDGDHDAESGSAQAHGEPHRTASTVLAAPIILYDHPSVAPESPGPSFDATEVDELLALCVLGLSDDEKRRARATDPRAAALIDRTDTLPAAVRERLHGTVRELRPADLRPEPAAAVSDEVRDLLGVGEAPVRAIRVGDHTVEVGGRVVLRPRRRADAHDLFADGRVALVERIVRTEEGEVYLAVTLEDDPAAELHRWYGRFQYFGSDEVEPLPVPEVRSTTGPGQTDVR